MIDIKIPVRNWKVTVPCSEANPDAWFPDNDGDGHLSGWPDDNGREITAKRVCQTCPVINECLQEALDRKEPHGIWGGLTTKERNKLRRQSR